MPDAESLHIKVFSHGSKDRDSVVFLVKSNLDFCVVPLRATSHRCDAFSVQIMVHTACVRMSSLYWLVDVRLARADCLCLDKLLLCHFVDMKNTLNSAN